MFVIRKLGRALLVGMGVMCTAFALIHLIPGDPVKLLLGDQATPDSIEKFRQTLGLDGSLASQFFDYVRGLARFDLGDSLVTGQPVKSLIWNTLSVTGWLVAFATVISVVIALPLAVLVALQRGTWIEQVFRVITSVLLGLPVFFSGLLAILLLAVRWGLAPVAGYTTRFPANLEYLWLPAVVLSGLLVPVLSRVLQASIAETLDEEFVESAIVRCLPRRVFVWRYLLRPSVAPSLALLGYITGQLLGTAVVVELIFGLPGIGTQLMLGVSGRDYSVVQGIVFVFGLIVVFLTLIADVLSGVIDPRTRTS